jgi:hypothetical protein
MQIEKKKCIDGLKQAPKAWHNKSNDFLLKCVLTQSSADPCLLFRHEKGEVTIVKIYVDDRLVMSNKKHLLTEITEYLGTHFQIRCLPADRFIGLDIVRDRSQRKIYVSQHHLITKMLKRYSSVFSYLHKVFGVVGYHYNLFYSYVDSISMNVTKK